MDEPVTFYIKMGPFFLAGRKQYQYYWSIGSCEITPVLGKAFSPAKGGLVYNEKKKNLPSFSFTSRTKRGDWEAAASFDGDVAGKITGIIFYPSWIVRLSQMELQDGEQPIYYTRKQKVDLAIAQGFAATERLHADWVAKGLVGRGEGRKKGVGALWSGQQLELWLRLLKVHQQTHELDTLCNIPVFLWLYVGESADVSLTQIKRAMETWAKANRKSTTMKDARKAANQLLHSIVVPNASGKRKVASTLAKMHFDGNFDKEEFLYLLREVLGANKHSEKNHTLMEPLTPDLVHMMLLGRQSVMENVYQFEDAIWEWARALILVQAAERQREDPQTLKRMISSSCANLITVLAVAHQITHFGYPNALLPCLQPSLWREGKMAANIKVCFERSPLALPLDCIPRFSIEIVFAPPEILKLHPDMLK